MILDPDFGAHASRPNGEQTLLRAVVARTVLDLFAKVLPASEKDEAQFARREALYFLTRESGAWAASRRRICEACEIDPDGLRTNVLRILDGGEIVGADVRNSFGGIEIARQIWQDEQTETARASAARAEQVKRRPKVPLQKAKASYSAIRSTILPLLSQPRQFKELIIATDGEFGDSVIRKVLANAMQKGEVIRNEENHTYVLAA